MQTTRAMPSLNTRGVVDVRTARGSIKVLWPASASTGIMEEHTMSPGVVLLHSPRAAAS